MKDQIQIVSWLITRKCNRQCGYCRISKDYKKPAEYPGIKELVDNEISVERINNQLLSLKKHNPDIFVLWYGGEPTLKKGFHEIIQHCNAEEINYSIITNGSKASSKILKTILSSTPIKGLTCSVDPLVFKEPNDRSLKTSEGLQLLLEMKEIVEDPVAEITVDRHTIDNLIPLLEYLSKNGINGDVTFIDIAKSQYYDFSDITDRSLLVEKTAHTAAIFQEIMKRQDLDVHMKSDLLPAIFNMLPANLDCEIEKNFHNLTVDSDGAIRLCLRIRGIETPKSKIWDLFTSDYQISKDIKKAIHQDKMKLCKRCNWTCMGMSRLLSSNDQLSDKLLHTDRRKV